MAKKAKKHIRRITADNLRLLEKWLEGRCAILAEFTWMQALEAARAELKFEIAESTFQSAAKREGVVFAATPRPQRKKRKPRKRNGQDELNALFAAGLARLEVKFPGFQVYAPDVWERVYSLIGHKPPAADPNVLSMANSQLSA